MQTLGYRFRPWAEAKAIADGPAILEYVRDDGARGRDRRSDPLRPPRACAPSGRPPRRAGRSTSSAPARGETSQLTCDFLSCCAGYYRYDEGYSPEFPGVERFEGRIVHPQFWPEDLDYAGKRVVVIGSGATAVTLVPALAEDAAHVTMLQRSPTYILSIPSEDPIANGAAPRASATGARIRSRAGRTSCSISTLSTSSASAGPRLMKRCCAGASAAELPPGYDVDTPLQPALRAVGPAPVPGARRRSVQGASSAGGRRWSPTRSSVHRRPACGSQSGDELEADIIVTATGLNLLPSAASSSPSTASDVDLPERDGLQGHDAQRRPELRVHDRLHERVVDAEGRPRGEYVCRLLATWTSTATRQCVPRRRRPDRRRGCRCWTSTPATSSARSHLFPKGGLAAPWRLGMSYAADVVDPAPRRARGRRAALQRARSLRRSAVALAA